MKPRRLVEIWHFMALTDQESEDCEMIQRKYQKARAMIWEAYKDLLEEKSAPIGSVKDR